MKCARPNCSRAATRGASHGLCRNHATAAGVAAPMLPAHPVAEHIRDLHRHGWSMRGIAAAAGVDDSTVMRIFRGEYAYLRTSTATKLEAVGIMDVGARTQSAAGSIRRVQALQAAGYDQVRLAAETGVDQTTISKLSRGVQARVNTDIALKIDAAWQRLAALPVGEPTRLAKANRWPVPMAWNDIDDPMEEPGHTHCLKCDNPVLSRGLCKRCYDTARYDTRRVKARV